LSYFWELLAEVAFKAHLGLLGDCLSVQLVTL